MKSSDIVTVILVALCLHLPMSARGSAQDLDVSALRRQVLALGALSEPPAVFEAEGFPSEGPIEPIFYEGLPWQGKPTRVFAWLGVPESADGEVPAIVLLHGGGGTAFKEWVTKWNERGFAAIAMGLEGQIEEREESGKPRPPWKRHRWAGPARDGIYGDSDQPLVDQWMYHAVADAVLAGLLMRSLEAVDAERVGVAGISWGGVVTSTVIGIDKRFAFAVPIYGCGHLFDSDNQWGRALGENRLYREVWDPMVRIERARMPVLWLSWPGDSHFPLDCQAACYRAMAGPRMVALLPGMGHSHPAGWNPPDSYAFAESVVRSGKPWIDQEGCRVAEDRVEVDFVSAFPIDEATLVTTPDKGFTGSRTWTETPAELEPRGGKVRVSASLPRGSRAWFVNVRSGDLTASSEFIEIDTTGAD